MIEKFIFINASFLKKNSLDMTWNELLWGLDHAFISPKEISVYALQLLEDYDIDNSNIILLAGINKSDQYMVRELVEKLAFPENKKQTSTIEKKWLYVILLWLFENRVVVEDPLGKVELVYADFDYPVEIENFVRYMPPNTKSNVNETNESTIYEYWKEYLKDSRIRFKV